MVTFITILQERPVSGSRGAERRPRIATPLPPAAMDIFIALEAFLPSEAVSLHQKRE